MFTTKRWDGRVCGIHDTGSRSMNDLELPLRLCRVASELELRDEHILEYLQFVQSGNGREYIGGRRRPVQWMDGWRVVSRLKTTIYRNRRAKEEAHHFKLMNDLLLTDEQ